MASLFQRLAIAFVFFQAVGSASAQTDTITPPVEAALEKISPKSLREHLTYIASDELGGRDTPSPGLEKAAQYIAKQFEKAGLEPAGDEGYFQIAPFQTVGSEPKRCEVTWRAGEKSRSLSPEAFSEHPLVALEWKDAAVFRLSVPDLESLSEEQAAAMRDQVVVIEGPAADRGSRFRFRRLRRGMLARLTELGARGVLFVSPGQANDERGRGRGNGRRLVDETQGGDGAGPAVMTVHDADLLAWWSAAETGPTDARLSIDFEPDVTPAPLKNVVGVLRGSDPELSKTYVLVTAHYDHIGTREGMEGDNIFNGANDDGSGTVSVIELAHALATLKPRPKRSLVFMTVFGEEKGLLGSRYYGRHPLFPVEKTIANINLEHMGRTDDEEGPQLKRATLTGFDYSQVGEVFRQAGVDTGIEIYKHAANSDSFFGRSDNQALADLGVPSHTVCVAFIFPDYHGPGDHADLVDYDNLSQVLRAVGLTLTRLANDPEVPQWDRDNRRARRYVEAYDKLHGKH